MPTGAQLATETDPRKLEASILFATFSGFLANLFLSANKGAPEHNAVDSESDVQATLQHVERLHIEQQAALDQLRAQIAVDNAS